jgi:photosystem II stability/assembly factor-like uncharacterized protein
MGNKLILSAFGGGIYISTDNGNTWNESNAGITNMYQSKIVTCKGVILAGSSGNGINRSIDSGATWNRVITGLTDGYINTFATSGDSIYAGTYGGIFRSSDIGMSWSPVDSIFKNIKVYSLAINGNTIFAGTSDSGIFRSTDNGVNWSFIRPEPKYSSSNIHIIATNNNTAFAVEGYSNTSKIYRSIDNGTTWSTVFPGRSNTFINSITFNGNVVLAATTIGIFISNDSGTTWNSTNTNPSDTIAKILYVNGNTIFAGTKTGDFVRSTNNGDSWISVNTGLANMSTNVWATSNKTLFAMTDRKGIFRSIDNGINWIQITIAPENPRCNSFLECGDTIFTGTSLGAFFSTDTGSHWTPINAGIEGVSVRSWAKHGNDLFIGTPNGIYSTSTRGKSWTLIGLNSIYDLSVTSLLMCGETLLAATYKHGVFCLTKNDSSWNIVNTGLVKKDIWCLAISGNTVLAGTFYGIFRSRDKGMTWPDTIMPPSNTNSLLVLDTVILAAGNGVYCSKDTGLTWAKVNTGLPTATANSTISSITVCGDNLFAGVNAKSVWKRPLQEILNLPKVNVRKELRNLSSNSFSINAVSGRKISFEFCLDQPGKVWCAVYDLSGRLVSVIIDQALAAGLHNQTRDARSMSKGCYLVRFQASGVSEVRMVRLLE